MMGLLPTENPLAKREGGPIKGPPQSVKKLKRMGTITPMRFCFLDWLRHRFGSDTTATAFYKNVYFSARRRHPCFFLI